MLNASRGGQHSPGGHWQVPSDRSIHASANDADKERLGATRPPPGLVPKAQTKQHGRCGWCVPISNAIAQAEGAKRGRSLGAVEPECGNRGVESFLHAEHRAETQQSNRSVGHGEAIAKALSRSPSVGSEQATNGGEGSRGIGWPGRSVKRLVLHE